MISAVILSKNEQNNIAKCLESLRWCDERIVIDDESVDATLEIAQKHHAKVIGHALRNDFSTQRNYGLEKAKGEWVLFVDADEIISNALALEIESRIMNQDSRINGYYIKRVDFMWGKQLTHGEQGNMKLLRLAKKGSGKWVGKVHEVWQVPGPTATLENPLFHYPHPTLKEFLEEINFYSTLRAKELFEQRISTNWLDILLHAKGKFFQDYVLKLGFLDGTAGFVVAMLMSLHAFLVRGKLWQLSEK